MTSAFRDLTETHCPYCALQCGMGLSWNGAALEVTRREFPTNRGGLCRKGWTAAELLVAPDRLTSPLMRRSRGEPLRPVSWERAIARVASTFTRVQEAHGRDAIGVFGGGGLTNEKAYALGKFARVVLRTRHIDYNGRFCMASAAVANQRAFGVDRGLPFPVSDIPGADAILLVGANPAETMPPLVQYFDEQRTRGGRLIVADPRRTATAAIASMHLQLTPGTDAALANGLLHVAVRDKLIDSEFLEARTTGFEAVRRVVATYWPDRAERITGVPAKKIVEAAHLLGEAATAMIMTARGPEQQSHGVDNVLGFINLALALGKVGKPHCGFGCITGQGNGQGGREHGQKSDQLPGYRRLDNPAHREHVAAIWGIPAADLPAPGVSATEMLANLGREGGVRALMVMGSNLLVSTPNARTLQPALDKLDLLVVADLFLSETAEGADVVFPACQWAEEEGTMTNLEGRLLYRRAARAPAGDSRTDLQILALLARALGRGQFMSDVPEDVFNELRKCSAGGVADYAGITYERLRRGEAIFWPCPSDAHPGTPRLFLERFSTPDGRARLHAVEHKGPAEDTDEQYPMYLTTGRVLSQYQSGTQTSRVASLREADPEPFVEMHPHVAAGYGIGASDWVALKTRRGRIRLKARLNPSMRLDTVFVPFHWGGAGRANTLTNDALDPDSKIPEFKVAAVAIEKATPEDRGESMDANPRFIQGVFPFEGKGLESPTALPGTDYSVPADKRAQFVYLRAGNSAHELIYLVLTRDGKPMRYFPIGGNTSVHVPLAVVEDIFPESKLGLLLGAPKGASGTVVLDVGLLEVD